MVAPHPIAVAAPLAGGPLDRAALSRREALHDAKLVRRFNHGDPAAFVEIVARYRPRMLQVALALLRNHADAEEVAQDTFIRAHRSLAHFRGDCSLAIWLRCIALNLSRNRYWYFQRRQQHRALPLEGPLGEDTNATFADLISSPEPDPVQDLTTLEFSALVAACTERLSAAQREILDLRNVRQITYREIARLLGIRVGTVKSRIARARVCLHELIIAVQAAELGPRRREHLVEWFEPNRAGGRLVRV